MMLQRIFIGICILSSSLLFSQDFSASWEGHFSYFQISDVVYGNNKIYASTENVVFSYDLATTELNTITTVEGLSGDLISTIHYSEAFRLLIIGYENGLMEVYSEDDESILTVVDIIDKQNIPPDNKRINHFSEYEGFIYIAAEYGISVYDLERLEFGDTYFIGFGGAQINVNQTVVFGDYIYAANTDGNGLKRALVASDNLIDFSQWETLAIGNFAGVDKNNDRLYCVRFNRVIYEVVDTAINALFTYSSIPVDMKSANGNLTITLRNEVFVYDGNFNLISQHLPNEDFDSNFTAAVSTETDVYIGTEAQGMITAPLNAPDDYIEIRPDGPLRNNCFNIQAGFGDLWVSYGDYTLTYNPAPVRRYGISHLMDGQWNNIPYDSLQGAKNLNAISINPTDPTQVYISSFFDGILELNNGSATVLYNQTNSGLESLVLPNNPDFVNIRVSGSTFDRNGVLWSMTCRVDRPLKSFDPASGQWQGFDFTAIIPDGLTGELGFSDIVIDNNGVKWIGALRSGLIGFNNQTGEIKNIFDEEVANLPDKAVKALAVDNRNQLWIGTIRGLRVLYNTSNFFDNDAVQTQPIIILEDGIPKELLQFQYISDIKVDGGNNKWVSTIGSGIFYFSSDGQETIYHFTKDNSPLPSNNVIDTSIDSNTGIVYIATDRGLVAFRSGSSKPQDDLEEAFVFPNPVRPGFDIVEKKIKIKDISENVNIKITDIEGNLVAEAESNRNLRFRGYNLEIDGGTAYWNGKNLANNVVASGVYLIMLSDLDTLETRVIKLMVVR